MLTRVRDHHKLSVYRSAELLVVEIYRLSAFMPHDERYGLVAQTRRSAVSVASNIAEGSSRATDSDFARFIEIALGSARELDCQLTLIEKLALSRIDLRSASDLCDETTRMLVGLLRKLRQHGTRSGSWL